ncbi:hypothetical protein AAHC03_013900 [Spirometra sp. Aus1]|nr:unnamed protein product [Spirometra erinaceieuropaei]VZI36236.1 unnamed protein product [Spirometra erinaceieuropaei]
MVDKNVAREIFSLLDNDGSGLVKASDLLEAFNGTGLDVAEVFPLITKHDLNGDGTLSLKELESMLQEVHRKTSRVTV